MTRGGTDRPNTCLRAARAIRRSQLGLRAARGCRRSQLYGDSPASQSFVPITSALFESCSRNPTLAARTTACIINTRHSNEAPLRVDSGVLATPAKRVPAT
jgi:hypothetical protein